MKSANFLWLALHLCLFFAWSCKENTTKADQNTSVKAFSEYLGKPITLDVEGQVIDNDQLPIKNAKVYIGRNSTSTNRDGHFSIKNVSANENILTIKVSKKDYKNEQIHFIPKDHTTTINITLYKESELSLFWFSKNNQGLYEICIVYCFFVFIFL